MVIVMFQNILDHYSGSSIISIYQDFLSLSFPFIGIAAGAAVLDMMIKSYENAVIISEMNSNNMVNYIMEKVSIGKQFTDTTT